MPFSQLHANRAINFFEKALRHSGEYYGQPFLLCPWQEQLLEHVFGLLDDEGQPVTRLVYLEVPKKAGKTEFVAGLVCMFLALTTTKGCEIYGAAAGQRQALKVYQAASAMVEQSPLLSSRLRVLRSTHRILRRDDPNSFYAAIAADGDLTDGVNPRFVVCDELHRWKTRKQQENFDVLRLGGIARKAGTLVVAITTAGVKKDSPLAWRLHEKTERIEAGVIQDPTFWGKIYAAAPGDNWEDPKTWIKAHPSLKENGGFLELERIRQEYQACLSDPESKAAFCRYYLNLWEQKEGRAIDMNLWNVCPRPWQAHGFAAMRDDHEFMKRFFGRRCYPGVDLSFGRDMSAVTLVFPAEDGAFEVLPFAWMPEERVRKAELKDGMPYSLWIQQGFLETCEGNAIDQGTIRQRIKWACEMFDVPEVAFDRFNSREMSTGLIGEGMKCVEVPQIFTGLNEATKKWITLVETGKLIHGGHPVLTYNASCLCLKSDDNGLVRPIKPDGQKDSTHIDALSAGLNGLARALVAENLGQVYVGRI